MVGERRGEGRVVRSFLAYGFLLWLVATVVFRLFGQFVLVSGGGIRLVAVLILTVPSIVALMSLLYAHEGLDGRGRIQAAVFMVLPGMLLDVVALAFFEVVYPNMRSEAASLFGAFLLWAYALVLLTGLFPARAGRVEERVT